MGRETRYQLHVEGGPRALEVLEQAGVQLKGVGETTSTALVAMIGNAHDFDNGRQLAAWLGLVPGQYSSGGKTRLGRITKAGDPLLAQRCSCWAPGRCSSGQEQDTTAQPLGDGARARRGYWKAVVAIAAKNARMAWAVLTKGEASSCERGLRQARQPSYRHRVMSSVDESKVGPARGVPDHVEETPLGAVLG